MNKVEVDDIVLAEHMLVAQNKLDCIIELRKLKFSSAAMLNIAIYMIVEKLNSKTGKCNPKVKTIAAETGYNFYTVKDILEALKERGIIAATIKQKGSVQYFFAMPNASRLAANGGQSTPVTMGVNPPLSNGGQSTPIPYEVEKGTEEGELRSALATGNAFGGPSDFSSPIGKETVAGSSDPAQVDSDMGKEKEEGFNLYQAIKDGDSESIISMIESECGIVSDNWKSYIRKNTHDGTLTAEMIAKAKRETIADHKRAAA